MRWTGLAITPFIIPFLPYSKIEVIQILLKSQANVLDEYQIEMYGERKKERKKERERERKKERTKSKEQKLCMTSFQLIDIVLVRK